MPEISAGYHYLSPSSSLDFAAPRIHAPGGFSFQGAPVSQPVVSYRHAIIRAVTGGRPAMVFHVVDETALRNICERLAESERAFEILRAKGYGRPGLLLQEVAALVPDACS